MKPVEIVLRRGKKKRENDRGGKVSTYINITMYPPYNDYMLINFLN
jgi:hypothetical protein